MDIYVMLRNDWPGPFRRSIRKPDKAKRGEKRRKPVILQKLEFAPGVPEALNPGELAAVYADIRKKALRLVRIDDKCRPKVLNFKETEAGLVLDDGTTILPDGTIEIPGPGGLDPTVDPRLEP